MILRDKNNKKSGFTLIEMMVAIAVFSIVMVTAMSALLNVIDANNKAKAIKTAINNISFALEGISKDMRVGTEYTCGDMLSDIINDDDGLPCPTGGTYIKYRSIRADKESPGDPTSKYKYAYYKFYGTQMWSCLEKDSKICSVDDDFSPITSEEVKLINVVFYVLNVGDTATHKQPRMIMTIKGEAGGTKAKIKTEFDLQTSVSQMNRVTY